MGLYSALFLTWLIQAGLVAVTSYRDIKTHQPLVYALSQFRVIAHYLRLSFWPHPLCLDYYWPPAGGINEIIFPGLLIGALLGLTVWGLIRSPAAGFAGVCFFLLLAPTSSILPLEDLAFEHRMYLPLASLSVLGVAGGYEVLRRLFPDSAARRRGWGVALAASVAVALGTLTVLRNNDYQSPAGMWEMVIRQRPAIPAPVTAWATWS